MKDRKDAPRFVYCRSGAGGGRAVNAPRPTRHPNDKIIGGIAARTGKVEK